MILQYFWVDPRKDVPLRIEKDHILVDDEVTIPPRQLQTRRDDGPRVTESPLIGVEFFQSQH